MTTISVPAAIPAAATPRAQRALPVVGAVYVLAWVAGLLVPQPAAQALLVHGLAGLALAALAAGVGAAVGAGTGTGRRIAAVGLAAAAVSELQAALGLVAAYLPDGSGPWLRAVDDADVVKLALLAAFVALTTHAARLPRWLQLFGIVLVPLLVLGGLSFVVPGAALTALLTASLPALLVWAAAVGWQLRR